MPVHGIDNGNNKHEVYTTEELLAILQQAIASGSLQGIDPSQTPIVAAVREGHNNSNVTFWSGTEAEFNELTDVASELVGARIGSDGKLYLLTGDTTLSDTVEAARQAAIEATEGMKREVISVTLTAEGWSDTAPYTQTVAVTGMTADKDFLAPYLEPSGNEDADMAAQIALSCISGGETSEGAVTFYCYEEKPATTITVYMVDKGTKLESSYPVATTAALGMVKVGEGLSVDQSGELSAVRYEGDKYFFNSVAEMVSYGLEEGDTAITLGYYTANDGGGATYYVVEDASLVDDGGSIIALSGDLKARLVVTNNIVNVKQFGAKGDGIADDTNALQDAATYAQANGCAYYVPVSSGNYISGDLTLDMIRVIKIEGSIALKASTNALTILGSVNAGSYNIFIHTVTTGEIIMKGLNSSDITVQNANKLRLIADSTTNHGFIGYNKFYLGFVRYLELEDDGSGSKWINENLFIGGRFLGLTIGANNSTYPHQQNLFLKPMCEHTTITINNSFMNRIQEARLEGTCVINFGAGAMGNTISQNFADSVQGCYNDGDISSITVNDSSNGRNYLERNPYLKKYDIFTLNAFSNPLNLPVQDDKVYVATDNTLMYRSEIVKLPSKEFCLNCRTDNKNVRFRVRCYDENKQLITSAPSTALLTNSPTVARVTVNTYGNSSYNRDYYWFIVVPNNPDIKYIDISVFSYSTDQSYGDVKLTLTAFNKVDKALLDGLRTCVSS